ncbi:MAG: TRAP transporter substrate-binding protein DctP [Elusimicrobiota bacterium]
MNYFKTIVFLSLFATNTVRSEIVAVNMSSEPKTVIKFATLAPEGTTWTKILKQFSQEVQSRTQLRVTFKIYTGGVQGDEKDVIRKIKTAQLNASGFTGFGLGEIAKELRVLDAPFLFKNTDEIDHIYSKFNDEFSKILEEKGFILLGWAEIGDVYIVSKNEIKSPQDLAKSKLWVWEGDEIALKTFETFGVKPIPLSISDVMTSIQTGMINTVYATPATIIPLGWHNNMNYILDMPITYASGAVLLSKATFEKLKEEDKKILIEAAKKHFSKLNKSAREDNKKGLEILKNKLKVVKPQDVKIFEDLAAKARENLKNYYGNKLIEKIEKELSNYRNAKKSNNKN